MSHYTDLTQKSVHAAVAAIEIYNKPDFHYREEAFSLLMTNAWELLLKAKWLIDRNDDLALLYEYKSAKHASGQRKVKLNRSGNPITFGATYLAAKLLEDSQSGFSRPCHDNLVALLEIRDNSAHFVNKDLNFGRTILEIGTASLQNYLRLVTEWFQFDLSRYNFFLMPLSFYHGFEAVTSASVSQCNEQTQRLLAFLKSLQDANENDEADATGHVALRIKTSFVRARNADAVSFRWTDDPSAPAVSLTEEDLLRNYPLSYRQLVDQLRRKYSNFVQNRNFHRIRKEAESEKKYSIVRFLDPGNPRSQEKRFYNPNIIQEFDKHYTKREKTKKKKKNQNGTNAV